MNAALFTPKTLSELFAHIAGCAGEIHFVAGATDWIPRHAKGLSPDSAVIDLSSLEILRGIKKYPGHIAIGSMETMTALSENELLRAEAACLAEAAQKLGSWQIRNRATVGGNIANASPAADTPVALAALGAAVILQSADGRRELPVSQMAAAPGKSILRRGELITEIHVPIDEKRISAFGKIGSRTEVSIARLNMAACVTFGESKKAAASIFVGALGANPLRAEAAEKILNDGGAADAFCDALSAFAADAIPGRASLPYKRRAIRALGEDILKDLQAKAQKRGMSL
ncbi:FAD binding domain-containing protein [Synergistaceae bacterium OttesenSCG-928-D05]|nr:FAD binding domain-containing protein [Synergistaceae bacterium OttesenSCG-928-D05]